MSEYCCIVGNGVLTVSDGGGIPAPPAGAFAHYDPATGLADQGSGILRWADQSGNGNHFQNNIAPPGGSFFEVVPADLNSLDTIRVAMLTGGSVITEDRGFGQNATGVTIGMVARLASGGDDEGAYFTCTINGSGSADRISLTADASSSVIEVRGSQDDNATNPGFADAALADDTFHYIVLRYDPFGNGVNGSVELRVDGSVLFTDSSFTPSVSNLPNTTSDLARLAQHDGGSRGDVRFGDILFYNSRLDNTDTDTLEAFLSGKWDL